jgi:hypothetical protein
VLGASAICEYSIADQGILLAGVSEQTALGVKTSVGVGIMSGVSTIDGNFTATTAGIFISAGANAELSGDFTQTSAGTRARLGTSEIESAFTKTSNGIMIGSGVSTTDLNFSQDSLGELLFEEINAGVRIVIVGGQETEVESKEDWSNVDTSASDETSNYANVNTGSPQNWTEIVR